MSSLFIYSKRKKSLDSFYKKEYKLNMEENSVFLKNLIVKKITRIFSK